MPFTDARPINKQPAGTGISFSIMKTKSRGISARITFRKDVQAQLFGGPIEGKAFHVQVGRGAHEGLLRIVMTADGEFIASRGTRGSSSIRMSGWDLLPTDKRPASSCVIKEVPSNVEVIIALPPFCKPSGVGGKMESEFGIRTSKEVRREGSG